MTLEAKCPFCEWVAKQSTGKQDEDLIRSYLAKALMQHLRLKHARHDILEPQEIHNIAFSTIVSSRTGEGMVEFSFNNEMSQWDLTKAREIHQMLGEVIEAAVSDMIIMKFLKEKVGLDEDRCARALLDFRELRHGYRKIPKYSVS